MGPPQDDEYDAEDAAAAAAFAGPRGPAPAQFRTEAFGRNRRPAAAVAALPAASIPEVSEVAIVLFSLFCERASEHVLRTVRTSRRMDGQTNLCQIFTP